MFATACMLSHTVLMYLIAVVMALCTSMGGKDKPPIVLTFFPDFVSQIGTGEPWKGVNSASATDGACAVVNTDYDGGFASSRTLVSYTSSISIPSGYYRVTVSVYGRSGNIDHNEQGGLCWLGVIGLHNTLGPVDAEFTSVPTLSPENEWYDFVSSVPVHSSDIMVGKFGSDIVTGFASDEDGTVFLDSVNFTLEYLD